MQQYATEKEFRPRVRKKRASAIAEARLLFWPVDQQMELSYSAIGAPCA